MDLLRNSIKSIQGRTKETLDFLERMTEGDLKIYLRDLLKERKGLNEWQKVKDHLWKNIKEDKSIEISNIQSLSYNDLSTALKQCFLYFGIFPEDQVVKADNIIRLSMAEGFIPRGEERMEDVAEGFLNELIRRSLVQVDYTFWERVTKCMVHDLLRDLAIQKALELRSIMFFDRDFRKTSLINFRSVFQHLYVLHLDMNVGNMSIVPDAIGSLYHLKLLRLRGIRDLPSSIGNLKNLQTLVVNVGGYTCQLPRETADLINFGHLVAWYSKPLKLSLEGVIEKLPDLFPNSITMMVLRDSRLTEDPMPILGMLPNLRNLNLFRAYEGKEIMCSDNNFSQLEFL
ncbi:hypothetical protein KY285_019578 [Solanum tuberosum]|nr:hypothetical protein KY285_019578 [Solanum tuberosum]